MSETTAKIALITGANKGIGLETAKQLGKLGVTILVGARDLAKGGQEIVPPLAAQTLDGYYSQLKRIRSLFALYSIKVRQNGLSLLLLIPSENATGRDRL